jgi:acyl-CoA thioester hydrolase
MDSFEGERMNHTAEVKIYYEDTDCGGVVYYANYLRYMEIARTEYLASKGYSVKKMMDEGTIFMVLHVEIDYKFPARYGDTIEIETRVRDVSRITMVFEHVMREKTSGRVLTQCHAKVIFVDPNARPKRLPDEFVEKVQ